MTDAALTIPSLTLSDGHDLPLVGLGTYGFDDDTVQPAIHAALERGIRHIDTARLYGNERGIGRAVAESGIDRSELRLVTKLWVSELSEPRRGLEDSLHRLGMDYVDIYLIHWPAPQDDRYIRAFEQLVAFREEGLLRSVGVSNFQPEHLDAVHAATGVMPVVNQIERYPYFQQADLLAAHAARGVATAAWSPLGRGEVFDDPVIQAIAAELDATPAQVILAWHLQRDIIVIPKSSSPQRMQANAAACRLRLSADQLRRMDELDRPDGRRGDDPYTFGARG